MKKSSIILSFAIALVVLSPFLYWAASSSIGYCSKTKSILSDDEKLLIVFRQINSVQMIMPDRSISSKEYIPYKDINEFIEENENCCLVGNKTIKKNTGQNFELPAKFRITDGYNDSVSMNYKVWYSDSGNRKYYKVKRIYHINSCGSIIN